VLVHGVGVGPWSYAALAAALAVDHEVVVAHRRGYGASAGLPLAASLHEQVEDLVELAAGPAAFVGVSGGATLVLALALACPGLVTAAVVHEPLVGLLAPALHAQIEAAASRLAMSPGEEGAVDFVRNLVGPRTWERFDAGQVAEVGSRQAVVRTEVPHFLAFSPSPAQLRDLAGEAVVSTVGEASPSSRHLAAAAVAAHTGSSPMSVPGIGHLAQVEGPDALAGALRDLENTLERRTGGHQHVLPAGRGHQLEADGQSL